MKKIVKCMALLLTLTALNVGCDETNTEDNTSSVSETITTSVEEVPTISETTTEIAEITTVNETPAEDNMDYKTVLNAYHQAYIDGNADAVYVLFCPEEISSFNNYMKSYLRDNLGESDLTVETLFSEDNIISAINGSIENIHGIMNNYNTSESDTWSINIDETTIEHYTDDELAEINSSLDINITDGYICEIPFYKNDVNGEIFVSEPCSILQIDSQWYISYSVACDRLIEFMNIEF